MTLRAPFYYTQKTCQYCRWFMIYLESNKAPFGVEVLFNKKFEKLFRYTILRQARSTNIFDKGYELVNSNPGFPLKISVSVYGPNK